MAIDARDMKNGVSFNAFMTILLIPAGVSTARSVSSWSVTLCNLVGQELDNRFKNNEATSD